MDVYPGAYCTYRSTGSTMVKFDPSEIDVYYYKYEGNTLPIFYLCQLV